jgi:ribosome recycling factor
MADDDAGMVIEEAREAMDKAIRSFRRDLLKVRTGRASTAILDGLQVEYFGTLTPLNQLANLAAPDARLLVINPYDKSAIAEIERAIQGSDLGVTPANDGKLIRISIPPLTEERRKDLVKQVRKEAEGHKVGVREARRDALSMLKDMEGEGLLPKDDRRRADKQTEDLTAGFVSKIDEMTAQKETEVLEV